MEAQQKKEVKAFLDSLGMFCWYFMPVPMGYGRKGIPDFIGCYKGRFFSIETKNPAKELTPWQHKENEAIRFAQGFTFTFGKHGYQTVEEFKFVWKGVF